MAADAALGLAALRHPGRGVVRTAGAEIGHAGNRQRLAFRQAARLGVEEFEPGGDAFACVEMGDSGCQRPGDLLGAELATFRQQHRPSLVPAADHPRPASLGQVVERVAHPALQEAALLLDDQDLFQAVGEVAHRLGIEGEGHADLQERDADVGRGHLVEAEFDQRLAGIHRRLARRDDAVAPSRPVDDPPVDLVRPRERPRGGQLVIAVPGLLLQPDVAGADRDAIGGKIEIGMDDLQALGIAIDGGGGIDRLRHHLEADPGARKAGKLPPQDAVVEDFLHAGGIEAGHQQVGEHGLRGRRHVGRLHRRVVAYRRQYTAQRRGAAQVGVADGVDRAVEARTLAVP